MINILSLTTSIKNNPFQGHSFHVNGSLRQDKTNMIASSHSHYNSQDTVTEILPEASICSSKMLLI